jgi:hypothetical protein
MPMKATPPSLTKNGEAKTGQITDVTKILEDAAAKQKTLASTKSGSSPSQAGQSVNKADSVTIDSGEHKSVSDEKK